MSTDTRNLLLVDGNSLINRAYYATALTNGAVYGFLNMFLRAVTDTKSTHVAVAFDVRAKTFRHKMCDYYKAHRKPMPEDLAAQIADLKVVLGLMNVTMYELAGYEADDVIGTLAKAAARDGYMVTILTADRDCLQLACGGVVIELTKTGVTNIEIYDTARIMTEFGVTPQQLIDVKALMGDKSDNIPGAMGIGEKTAFSMIKEFGNIETLLEKTTNKKVLDSRQAVIESKKLATIDCNVPIKLADECGFKLPLSRAVFNAFKARNFHSLCRRDNLWDGKTSTTDDAKKPIQQSFFQPAVASPEQNDILHKMHQNGCKIDLTALKGLLDKLHAEIADLTRQICTHAGEQFNINSPKQLGIILFKILGIEITSTNEGILHKFKNTHPIVPLVLRYRKAQKLRQYIEGLQTAATDSGFVHSTFQCNTATGRLSSSNPNIQNIPTRTEESKHIRALFISRFENGKILVADYSQIELRILAHLSGDQTMQSAFIAGSDIHDETARALGVDRRTAKAVNFGITYGQTSFGLAQTLDIPVGDATRIIQNYFARFTSVKDYLDRIRESAITNGFALDLFGNKRILPELNSRNHHTVSHGTRAAVNMPMQGSAAEIIKRAMQKIDDEITRRGLKSLLINQIHDELVFDCPHDESDIMSDIVKNIMESITKLHVPLVANIVAKSTL